MNNGRQYKVLVVMATFNGERYIAQQIESILNQRNVEVTLRISDDCSTDHTIDIINSFINKNSNIEVCINEDKLGVSLNFMHNLYMSDLKEYDYFALSDQDDVWDLYKLYRACYMMQLEDPNTPVLYFCNTIDIIERTSTRGNSTKSFEKCEAYLGTPLIRNYVNGCSMVFNYKCANLISLYKPEFYPRYHDAWIILIARTCGKVIADFEFDGVFHRVHSKNIVGKAKGDIQNFREIIELFVHFCRPASGNMRYVANELLEHYQEYMSEDYKSIIREFTCYSDSVCKRISLIRSKHYWLPSRQQRAIMKLKFLFARY